MCGRACCTAQVAPLLLRRAAPQPQPHLLEAFQEHQVPRLRAPPHGRQQRREHGHVQQRHRQHRRRLRTHAAVA
jgi:hypothetical protein